jgi:hypothetical protein
MCTDKKNPEEITVCVLKECHISSSLQICVKKCILSRTYVSD